MARAKLQKTEASKRDRGDRSGIYFPEESRRHQRNLISAQRFSADTRTASVIHDIQVLDSLANTSVPRTSSLKNMTMVILILAISGSYFQLHSN